MSDLQRFMAKVNKTESCWLWTACRNKDGYGRFGYRGSTTNAHRAAYVLFVGEIPEGTEIDHLCRIRHCVNPNHLEAVTHKVNTQRSVLPWRVRSHCAAGHPYSEENLYVNPQGERVCRICRRRHEATYRSKKKVA